ncbi:hypothetical protein C3409_32135 [Klebsiella oxytoca]|nr:hypothetical protein C2U44_06915 [Klebsiella oxytoca]POT81886.1 hypothetical protein C3417_32220 [Klebsiella oxytoca]POV45540.1 hypothetical protein C3409_32135 [Klebsiella oxytoca]
MVVILVVLTTRFFRSSLISQLLAKAIPVRETLFAVPNNFTMFRMNSVHTPVDGRLKRANQLGKVRTSS